MLSPLLYDNFRAGWGTWHLAKTSPVAAGAGGIEDQAGLAVLNEGLSVQAVVEGVFVSGVGVQATGPVGTEPAATGAAPRAAATAATAAATAATTAAASTCTGSLGDGSNGLGWGFAT